MSWDGVRHIQDGEAVDAAVTGRPDRALERRTDLLRRLLDENEAGAAAIVRDRPIGPAVAAGTPVYWDSVLAAFEPALAAAVDAAGVLTPDPRADCLGVCLRRLDGSSGDVVLAGAARIDLAAAVEGPVAPGRYFLSAAVPGRLVRQSPAVSVPVCFVAGDGVAFVDPAPRDFLTQHVHHRFDLACVPAGTTTPPVVGAPHVVTAPDPALRGWLPAAHPSFGGRAPATAVWGYNLAAHPELAAVWPPVPVSAAGLFVDRGAGGVLAAVGGADGIAVLDDAGIWWTTACRGEAPWPLDYDSASPPTADPTACPPVRGMRLVLAYAVDLFSSRWSVVSALKSASPALKVKGPSGGPAATGPLTVDFDLPLVVDAAETGGSVALSGLTATGGVSKTRVTEGLVVGPGLAASSSHPVAGPGAGETTHRGVVRLDLPPAAAGGELSSQVTYLRGAEPRSRAGVLYYAFPAGRETSIQFQFDVPANGLPANPTLAFKATLLGSVAGALPALTATVLRVPTAAAGAKSLPTIAAAMPITTAVAAGADVYVAVAGTAFAVSPGDSAFVTLTRTAADGYSGEVGLLRSGAAIGATP